MPTRTQRYLRKRLRARSHRAPRSQRRRLLLQNLEGRRLLTANPVMHDHVSAEMATMDFGPSQAHVHAMNAVVGACDAHTHTNPANASGHTAAMQLATLENATHHAVADGDWTSPDTWRDGLVPTDGAGVFIPVGTTVTVDAIIPETLHTVRIDGALRFDPTVNTQLHVDTIVSSPCGTLEMGTVQQPIVADATARILVADTGAVDRAWDPMFLSRGLVLHGTTTINGAAKNSWSALAVAPRAGDTSIQLSESPDGWRRGDSLVIAGTKADATGDEVITIASIEGNRVSFDQALQFDHIPPAGDLQVHVANTTRNAVIESENTAVDRRGHVMFMHTRNVQVDYAGFYELGRSNKLDTVNDARLDASGNLIPGTGTNPRGRYAVHFHINGTKKDTPPATVTGSAVVGSPGWGYVNHSSYVDFVDNVSYDVDGAAFNTEVGDEVGSFVNNLSIKTHGTGGEPFEDGDNQDYGRSGDGFWFHGSGITVTGNVAAGATGSGIIFWGETLIVGRDSEGSPPPGVEVAEYFVENLPDPSLLPGVTSIPTLYVPFNNVVNNQAYGSQKGFEVYHHGDGELSSEQNARFEIEDGNLDRNPFGLPRSEVDGVTVWNSQTGVKLNYTEHIRLQNVRIVNDFAQPGEIGFDAGTNLYNGNDHTYENLEISGFETGLLATRGESVVIDGGRFANQVDIAVPELRQTHRRLEIKGDIQFEPLPTAAPAQFASDRQNIELRGDLRNFVDGNVTYFLLNDRIILNYGEFSGQQLYFAEQAADHVPIPTQPEQVIEEDPGFPVAAEFIGKTNAQLQAQYGTSFGGVIPTPDAIDAPGDGIVGLIGLPQGDPAVPPKPIDVEVSVVDGETNDDEDVEDDESEVNEEAGDDDDIVDELDDEPDDVEEIDDPDEPFDGDDELGDESDAENEQDEAEDDEQDDEDEFDEEELDDDGLDEDEVDEFDDEVDELDDDEDETDELGQFDDDEAEDTEEEDAESYTDDELNNEPFMDDDEEIDALDQEDETDELEEDSFAFTHHHNANHPTDVNHDGKTSAIDALRVINFLSNFGAGPLQDHGSSLTDFLDVNQDGRTSAVDALMIINAIAQVFVVNLEAEATGTATSAFLIDVNETSLERDSVDRVFSESHGQRLT